MKRFRQVFALYLAVIALTFPLSAQAYWGEDFVNGVKDGFIEEYNDTKEDLGNILDFTEGALEVGWMGIYGAGCGVKNLATWDGTSCTTGVSESGDQFRSLIRDVDDCIANADPTTLLGMAAEETVNAEETGIGLVPSEVETLIGTAGQAQALSPAMQQYLRSPRGAQLIANLPGWAKVSRKLPGAKYVAAIVSLSATCGSTLDFLDYGLNFGLGGGPTIIERDGVWMECQWECVPKLDLNTADCNAQAFAPKTGQGLGIGYDPGDVTCTATSVGTTVSEDRQGIAPSGGSVNPSSVPGGSVGGSCSQLIRQVADSRSTAGYSSSRLSECLGTSDASCYSVRAARAAGRDLLIDEATNKRCFS